MTKDRARRVTWWVLVIALTGATVGTATLGGWRIQVKSQQLPPVADQPADRQAAIQAASTGTTKVLTYSPNTLEQDFSTAEALLTGNFLSYYKQFTSEIVAPAAREKAVTTTATVLRAGVESFDQPEGLDPALRQPNYDHPGQAVASRHLKLGPSGPDQGKWCVADRQLQSCRKPLTRANPAA